MYFKTGKEKLNSVNSVTNELISKFSSLFLEFN
jgi:hypothetical protein